MADPSTPDLSPPKAVRHLADVHDVHISEESLRRYGRDGLIPHLRLAPRGTMLFSRADLDAWVQRSRVAAS